MSRSVKVDLFESFNQPSGRVPIFKKTPFRMHHRPCFMCTKGHRYKQQQSKATRRAEKQFLQHEIDVFWQEFADEVLK